MRLAERTFRRQDYGKPWGRSLYGWRNHPITGERQFHYGEDLTTKGQNWPVYALENGIVTVSGFDNINGERIWVQYPRLDLELFYGHLLERYSFIGQQVDSSTVIGLVGTTGRSSGIHLHMGVRRISTKQYINPADVDWRMFAITGRWDEQFTRDLQFYLGTKIDGTISGQRILRKNVRKVGLGINGSQLIKRIQGDLGINQSGQLDAVTVKAMQARLGTPADGIISPTSSMVRAMQSRMNAGKALW